MMSYIGICMGGELDGQSHAEDRPIFQHERADGRRETYHYESFASGRRTLAGLWRHESLDLGQAVAHMLVTYQQSVLRPIESIRVRPQTLARLRDMRDRSGNSMFSPAAPQGGRETFAGVPVIVAL